MKTLFTLVISIAISSLCFSQQGYVSDELLVQCNPSVDINSVLSEYSQYGRPEVEEQLSEIVNVYKVSFDDSQITATELLRLIKSNEAVLNAQLNHFVQKRETIPNDPQLPSQWQHINDGSNGGIEDADIDTELAWDITTGGLTALGDTIVACVIEGGNLLHVDLIDNAWFNHGEIPENGIDDDENGFIDDYRGWNVQSENDEGVYQGGHGTNVMGMIGATGDNELGVVGANWNVKIMSVAGENLGNEASMIEAYNYPLVQRKIYDETDGDRGAFVVVTNASWGIDFGDPNDVPIWAAFYDTLGVYGILNCGATANNNVDIDEVGDIPTAVESDYMISVTATNNSDLRTFSAYGLETVDLGAPGSNIFTTSGGANYTNTSGTSFASPLTAGVIALLYSAPCEEFINLVHEDPQGGADYVRSMLFSGVDPVENLQDEVATGGRLNAFNSLQLLMGSCGEELCLNPFGLDYSVSADTLINFTWTSFSENDTVAIRYRLLGTEEWFYIDSLYEGSYTFSNLDYCSAYEFEIASECLGNTIELLEYSNNTIVETNGCCIAPEAVVEEDVTVSGASISWEMDFNIDGYDVYYRLSGETEWLLAGTVSEGSFELTALDSCAFYDILVKPGCIEGFDVGTEIQIRTKGCGHCIDAEFCESIGESTQYEFIESISIGDYTNESGDNGGYGVFENTELELEVAGTYDIVLTPGFQGGSFDQEFALWVDLDQDGDFSETELIFQSMEGSTDPVESTISIPEDAMLGNTRLRVAMKWENSDDDFNACGNLSEGEIEDYCLTLVESTLGIDEMGEAEFRLYPNPNKGQFFIELSLEGDYNEHTLEILDLSGKRVAYRSIQNGATSIDLQLASGAYIYVLSENGSAIYSNKLIITR
jgi:subtilisin family serine protease